MPEHILEIMKTTFGYHQFRPNQERIINHVLGGKDVFVVMPTGGGKSLCFQLPAKVLPGITIVISPLISLMKDQVDGVRENNIAGRYLNSSLRDFEMAEVYQSIRAGELDILYIAPERLSNAGFYNLLKQIDVSLFAIDEAHCISEWGHDFRPDYLELSRLGRDFPNVPIAAFTATATMKVQQDIIEKIGLRNPLTIRASFDRPNLIYHVQNKEDVCAQVLAYVKRQAGKPGIIYRTTRKSVEEMCDFLVYNGVKALPYHAGLENDIRIRNQDAFNKDKTEVICATIAFGMGIDKQNVRYVVHADLPKNLESYYQETGRAGRDGEPAECLFLFSVRDTPKIRYFINQIQDPHEQHIAASKLSAVIKYASHNTCRRKTLLEYFGENYEKENCETCDICNGEREIIDITSDAQIVMSAMARTGERFGIQHMIDVVCGADTKRIRQHNHQSLKTYGAGADKPKKYWSFVVDELLAQNAIIQTGDQYPVLAITDSGKEILFGKRDFCAIKRSASHDPIPVDNAESELFYDDVLFEILRTIRFEIAGEQGVPPYIIFSDRTLREMAGFFPSNTAELGTIHGVGEFKLQNYGKIFLDAINRYKEEHPEIIEKVALQKKREKAPVVKTPRARGESLQTSLEMFKEGLSIEDVAEKRGLALSTIYGHLEEIFNSGKAELNIDDYIFPQLRSSIEEAFQKTKTWNLTPVIQYLQNTVSFEQARIVRGYMQGRQAAEKINSSIA